MSWVVDKRITDPLRTIQPLAALALRQSASNADDSCILPLLQIFVDHGEPCRSPGVDSQDADSLDCLMSLLSDPGIEELPGLALAALKALKIVFRKKCNRLAMIVHEPEGGAIGMVMQFLKAPEKMDARIEAEAANVILNACYKQENVNVLLKSQGAIACLVASLGARADEVLQANAAGALASIAFHQRGAAAIRDAGGIPPLVAP